jgi:tight adherence protein C
MSTTTIVAILVFACASLLAYGTLSTVFSDDRRVRRRLRDLTAFETHQATVAEPMLTPFGARVLRPMGTGITSAVRRLWPPDYRQRLAASLVRAGNPRGVGVDRLLVAKVVGLIGGAGVALAISLVAPWSVGVKMLVVVGAAALFFWAPDLWLSHRVQKRQGAIVRELPDMLDMLTISVEAGLGFDAALAKLVRNSEGALAEEFGRVLQEVQAGSSRKEALRHLAERMDVSELAAFTGAIVQADMFGISIAHVLHTQAGELRLRRRQRAEELAQKAPVKMVIPLVTCLLPATIIVILGPAAARIAGLF